MKAPITTGFTLAAALLATVTISANGESFPQPGDPLRWYEPSDTPIKRYKTLMKEAGAALKEALEECRRVSDRRACEAEARETYRTEVANARAVLETNAS
ncbi:hypothetical protein [Usitatibacter palustris]|uniref:UrcA family protein n=1 Tax=Usitatibacter palustris TaxID=2732487 RepID=A0A6M4H2A8_9PROT|nr:hypothetical protein [Usitatibacter palustris]QJR13455.1 hypothetical protein DSM104440_00239 [Usitatibacter palustris]